MQTNYSFIDFRTRVAFLQNIPQDVASDLCFEEFYFPDTFVQEARQELETIFNHYVMTYSADVFRKDLPLSAHLCAQYKGAFLTANQKAILTMYEKKFASKNVRFVVYQKPLTKIALQESPFYQNYANLY